MRYVVALVQHVLGGRWRAGRLLRVDFRRRREPEWVRILRSKVGPADDAA